jgi:hypothetical protein
MNLSACRIRLGVLAAFAGLTSLGFDAGIPWARAADTGYTADKAAVSVRLALDCAHREYPNQIQHVMHSDRDQGTPRSLHPAFYGCYDWHSSVHGHWLLARFARIYPDHPLAADARAVLDRHLRPALIAQEAGYLLGEGREPWQRPYGLAWLLQLVAELREWANEDVGPGQDIGDVNRAPDHDDVRGWLEALAPLEEVCVGRFVDWLPKLAYPIRTGEHSQTAFAFGLVLDYARTVGRSDLAGLIEATSLRLYEADRNADLSFEPSGQDFLSPVLAEADLMRRIMTPPRFAEWLAEFLPQIPHDGSGGYLPVALVTDRIDGKLAHIDGLNLSRAWMLEGIAAGLPADDSRKRSLVAAARTHTLDGLAAVTGEHYAGGHWLGTYAMYLTSRRGVVNTAP